MRASALSRHSKLLVETASIVNRSCPASAIRLTIPRQRLCYDVTNLYLPATWSFRLQNYMYGQRDAGFFGHSHFTGGFPGGQAEYVRVPKGQVNLLPIPDNVTDEQSIYLSDILPTSYHAVVDTGVQKGDVVGIWVNRF
jgi:hypothetical protein